MEPRRARIEDVPDVHRVLAAAFTPLRSQYTEASFRATVASEAALRARWQEGPTWLLDGLATVGAVPRHDGVYLRSMAVAPDARGTGLGSALVRVVDAFAANEGAARVYLSTTPFLHAAIRLYERHGFRRTDAPPHDLHGTPLFTMEKRL